MCVYICSKRKGKERRWKVREGMRRDVEDLMNIWDGENIGSVKCSSFLIRF
jgi:hypothetical protein